ncbi:MAG TPA: aromatic ring-hydroxylating dioxygenase subunit alpha [Sphingomonas sp.]|nr:aromatic ring-hydroxylating dioxygenase subunit alpha [Sphingomonas sp.]
MYPFGTEQGYPRNRWYIAAFSDEISTKPIERTLLGVPVALYRTEEGRVVAMYGLCPHRYYPLARGVVEGDALVCGYHGFTFASSGKCIRIPAQGAGAGFTQPTYPLVERGFLTWIWMGNADLADESLIPPYVDYGLDQPGWATSGRDYFELKARSQLLIDNLMDLTHLPHVHHHIPGGDVFLKSRQTLQERSEALRLRQEMKGPWTPFYSFLWGEDDRFKGEEDTYSVTDFYGPELIRTSGPLFSSLHGKPELPPTIGEVYFLHGVTPRTATTTHYFCFQTRNFRIDDTSFGEALGHVDKVIREQDVETIEAVEQWVECGAAAQRELLARTDRAGMAVRERIKAMILAEQGSRSSAASPLPALADQEAIL